MRRTIKRQLALVSVVVVVLTLSLGIESIVEGQSKLHNVNDLQTLGTLSTKISRLVHESQKERGTSAGFIGSTGKKFADALSPQRQLTDKEYQHYQATLTSINFTNYPPSLNQNIQTIKRMFEQLPSIRSRVDSLSISVAEEVGFYSLLNKHLLDVITSAAMLSSDSHIANQLSAYANFLKAKERAGIERAVLSNTFAADTFAPNMFVNLMTLVSEQASYTDSFLATASPKAIAFYEKIIQSPIVSGRSKDAKQCHRKSNARTFWR